MKVLFVEDRDDHFRLFSKVLTDRGHTVDWEPHGNNATAHALAGDYDFVVMDVDLPLPSGGKVDGELLARNWRKRRDKLGQMPVLLLTTFKFPEQAERETNEDWERSRILACSKDEVDVRLSGPGLADPGARKRFEARVQIMEQQIVPT